MDENGNHIPITKKIWLEHCYHWLGDMEPPKKGHDFKVFGISPPVQKKTYDNWSIEAFMYHKTYNEIKKTWEDSKPGNQIQIYNLPGSTTETQLREMIENDIGNISRINKKYKIKLKYKSKKRKVVEYALIEFEKKKDVKLAIQKLNGKVIGLDDTNDKKTIRVIRLLNEMECETKETEVATTTPTTTQEEKKEEKKEKKKEKKKTDTQASTTIVASETKTNNNDDEMVVRLKENSSSSQLQLPLRDIDPNNPKSINEKALFRLFQKCIVLHEKQLEICGSFGLNLLQRFHEKNLAAQNVTVPTWYYGDIDIFCSGAKSVSGGPCLNFSELIQDFEKKLATHGMFNIKNIK